MVIFQEVSFCVIYKIYTNYLVGPLLPKIAFSMNLLAFFKELMMSGPITKQSWTTSLRTNLQRISGKCLPDFQKTFNYAFDNYLHATDVCADIVDDELYPQIQTQLQAHSQRSQLENLCPACCSREPEDDGYFIFSVDGNF